MNGYICFFRGKKIEVLAETTLAAQTQAAKLFKAKKAWEVTCVLAEKDNVPVVHVAVD